jgi:cytochrome b561
MTMPTHFSASSMVYHWVMATLIFSVGLTSPFLDHLRWPALSMFHNWGGVLILVLALGWYGVRRVQPALPESPALNTTEQRILNIALRAMEILMIVAPISGLLYLYMLLKPDGISSTLPPSATLYWLGISHHILSALLVSIAGAHSLHAVWHHVVKRDGYLGRMLPGHDAPTQQGAKPSSKPQQIQ